jgi:hypothetical protein
VREAATAAGGEIVMDNLDPGAAGDSGWVVNTCTGGGRFWGANVTQNDPGTPAEVFTWTPTLPAAQRYRVYARWTQDPNRATDAPYTVHHDGGASTVTANQEVNGGEWVPLGSFAMTPGQNHCVVLSDQANERVAADAVRLVRESTTAAGGEIVAGTRGQPEPRPRPLHFPWVAPHAPRRQEQKVIVGAGNGKARPPP